MARKRTGAPYRRVIPAFWNDPGVRALGPVPQLFLLYLITNEHSHPSGIYRLRLSVVLDDFPAARDREHLLELLAEVSAFATYDPDAREVLVHRMAEYQFDGPLKGRDKRVTWLANHLASMHSTHLLDSFRSINSAWDLPWHEIKKGWREAPSQAPSQDPKATGFPHSNTPDVPDVEKEGSPLGSRIPTQEGKGHGMGHGKGHGMPDPDPDPEEKGYSTSYPSSRSQIGGEIENILETGRRPKHPATDTLWRDRLRSAVFETWHHGREEIDLDETTIGIGREYWIVNELLNYTKDPDLVTWLVETAPLAMGWADEPRSLYWLLRGENLGAATSAYFKRQDNGKRNARIDSREEERQVGDRKAELRRQLEEGRAHG